MPTFGAALQRLAPLSSLALALAACGCTTPPAGPDTKPAAEASADGAEAASTPAAVDGQPPDDAAATAAPEAAGTVKDPSGGYTANGELYYQEVITGGAAPDDALPMIVAIHGLGDEPKHFAGLLSGLPVKARIILPRAINDYEVGWSWFPTRARDPDVEALARGIASAADVIDAGVRRLEQARPTVGKPIVMGFSQGGMLTFTLAVRFPDHYAAAMPVGGWLPPPLWPETLEGEGATPPPIVALHGDADPAVKIQPTRDAVTKLRELGAEVELHEYSGIGHAIPPDMRVELHGLLAKAVEAQAKAAPASD